MKIFIIAEVGINHNGDIEVCKKLIDEAALAGCDAVKFQKRDVRLVYSEGFLSEPRESPWGKTQLAQKEGLEFGSDQYEIIDDYCRKKNIDWFASAWDLNSQNFLKDFGCKYNKIASPMLVHKELLEAVASEKKHTFVSTGMSSIDQIAEAIKIFRSHECSFELMHCVSTYPMREEDANLRVINSLRDQFNCDVGYSGHESGLAVSCAAAAFGITSLERHITLDRAMYGSDQSASLEPLGLKQLVGAVRKIEKSLGDGVKRVTKEESEVAKKLREHLPEQ